MKPTSFCSLLVGLSATAALVEGELLLPPRGGLDSEQAHTIAEMLSGSDPIAWSAAAKELASRRRHPLDCRGDLGPPGEELGLVREMPPVREALEAQLTNRNPQRRAEAVEALVGLHSFRIGRRLKFSRGLAMRSQKHYSPTPLMVQLSEDQSPRVRAGILWLWRLDDDRNAAPLAEKLLDDDDPAVRAQAILAIAQLGTGHRNVMDGRVPWIPSRWTVRRVCKRLGDADKSVRVAALRAASAFGAEEAAEQIVSCLGDPEPEVRRAAAFTVGDLKLAEGGERLLKLLGDKTEGLTSDRRGYYSRTNTHSVADAAIWALGALGDIRAVEPLLAELARRAEGKWELLEGGTQAFTYPKHWYAQAAADALGKIGGPQAYRALREAAGRREVSFQAETAVRRLDFCWCRSRATQQGTDDLHAKTVALRVRDMHRLLERSDRDGRPVNVAQGMVGGHGPSPREWLIQIFTRRPDYDKDDPLSLIVNSPAARLGALDHFAESYHSLKLKPTLAELCLDERPVVCWGALYLLAIAGEPIAETLTKDIPKEGADARLFAGLALAELRDPRAGPLLEKSLSDSWLPWRARVMGALVRMGDKQAVRRLITVAEAQRSHNYIRSVAVNALVRNCGEDLAHVLENWVYRGFYSPVTLEGLSRLTREGKFSKERLARALRGRLNDYGAVLCAEHRLVTLRQELLGILAEREQTRYVIRANLCWALAVMGDRHVPETVLELMGHESRRIRWAACTIAGYLGRDEALGPLIARTADRVPDVRIAAARALGFWVTARGGESRSEVLDVLRQMPSRTYNLQVRIEALAARAKLRDATAAAPLRQILKEGPEGRRLVARAALGALGDKKHLEALREQLTEELDRGNVGNCRRAYEIIRLLGWCGDHSSLALLEQIPQHPCAEGVRRGGTGPRWDLLGACSLARWRIRK